MKTESQEQQKLILKLRWLHPELEFFSIPNGGRRNVGEGRRLVLEGAEKGTFDLFIAEPRKGFHGLFIELKRQGKSKVSEAQKIKLKRYLDKGYDATISYGADEAYKYIQNYIGV